jgi:hypothetical protein
VGTYAYPSNRVALQGLGTGNVVSNVCERNHQLSSCKDSDNGAAPSATRTAEIRGLVWPMFNSLDAELLVFKATSLVTFVLLVVPPIIRKAFREWYGLRAYLRQLKNRDNEETRRLS